MSNLVAHKTTQSTSFKCLLDTMSGTEDVRAKLDSCTQDPQFRACECRGRISSQPLDCSVSS